MLRLVIEAIDSDLTWRQFCRQNEILPQTLHYWRTQFTKQGALDQIRPKAIAAPLREDAPTQFLSFDQPQGTIYLVMQSVSHPSIDKLCAIVSFRLQLDPFCGDIFFFVSQNRKRLFALRWCGNGFALLCRRIEVGRFPWPTKIDSDGNTNMTQFQLQKLINTWNGRQQNNHIIHEIN